LRSIFLANKPAAEDFLLTFSSEKVRALAALAQRRKGSNEKGKSECVKE
jgi:hypothetical protein